MNKMRNKVQNYVTDNLQKKFCTAHFFYSVFLSVAESFMQGAYGMFLSVSMQRAFFHITCKTSEN